jgi:dTDP-4-dehydrorhamnose reductase
MRELAKLCRDEDVLFVTLSSDYVFDGKAAVPYEEYDKTGALQIYGISRLAGEHAVLSVAPENSIIIRTCGLYGMNGASSKGGNFVDNLIKDALNGNNIEMGCDQVVSPTSAVDLAKAVIKLLQHPDCTTGIYHLVNEGCAPGMNLRVRLLN